MKKIISYTNNFESTINYSTEEANSVKDDILFQEQDYYVSEENYLNEIRHQKQQAFAKQLVNCIKDQHFEYGVYSNADSMVENEFKKNLLVTKNTLNRLFTENFETPEILIGILQIVSRLPMNKIIPEGYTMATAAISHQNIEVQECAVRCFENWTSSISISILKNVSVKLDWLQDYIDTVINNIEEELCHS